MSNTQHSSAVQARRVRAHGLVQGVGFRDNCARQARAEGIAGWVRNRADGSVEAFMQGPSDSLDRLCEWLRHRVPGARVVSLDVEPVPPEPALGPHFERRPTA